MGRHRKDLDKKLREVSGCDHFYYSPPSSSHMDYPCIRYAREGVDARFADNKAYQKHNRYTLWVIGQKSDEVFDIADRLVEMFEYCSIDRCYAADNLNHVVLTLFY